MAGRGQSLGLSLPLRKVGRTGSLRGVVVKPDGGTLGKSAWRVVRTWPPFWWHFCTRGRHSVPQSSFPVRVPGSSRGGVSREAPVLAPPRAEWVWLLPHPPGPSSPGWLFVLRGPAQVTRGNMCGNALQACLSLYVRVSSCMCVRGTHARVSVLVHIRAHARVCTRSPRVLLQAVPAVWGARVKMTFLPSPGPTLPYW